VLLPASCIIRRSPRGRHLLPPDAVIGVGTDCWTLGLAEGARNQPPMVDLLRQAAYCRSAGREEVGDAECLAEDSTFRLMGSERIFMLKGC